MTQKMQPIVDLYPCSFPCAYLFLSNNRPLARQLILYLCFFSIAPAYGATL